MDRLANLVGAAALAVTDNLLSGATSAAGLSSSEAAAVVILRGESGVSVSELVKRLGLSQSACVRVVDSLERRGLVERRRSMGKWTCVYLTDDGRRAADGVLDARGDSLRRVVERLDDDGRRALADGLEQLLTSLYEEVGVADRMCRLCDRHACTSKASTCPVGAAERAHELTTTGTDSDQ